MKRKDMGLPVVVGVASLLLLAGCSKEQNNTSPINSDRRIEFRSADVPATKGTEITEVADGKAFGVSAWYAKPNPGGSYYAGYKPAFYNTAVTRSGSTYYYDNPVYWPVDPNICIRFFGWYPYGAGTVSEQTVTPPRLSFQVAQNVPEQVDLLYGVTEPLNNYANQDPVKFNFNHALTRVRFAVKFADDVPDGYKVDIKELYISGHDKGTLTFPATPSDTPTWTLDENSWNYYNLTSGMVNNTGITAATPREAVNITAAGYDLFMVPQEMTQFSASEGTGVTGNGIRIAYQLNNGLAEDDPGYRYIDNVVEISLVGQSPWQAGQGVLYTIVIGPRNASVVLQSDDWQDGNLGNEDVDFE